MSNNEASCRERVSISKEIEGYGHHQTLWYVNRDGDKFYIECPDCGDTDLTSLRILGCSKCHTRFSIYSEDGIGWQSLVTDMGSAKGDSANKEMKIIGKNGDDYFKQILYPRNYDRIGEIKKDWPDAKVVTLRRDLQKDGKDAHGHEKYKKYILIPLG